MGVRGGGIQKSSFIGMGEKGLKVFEILIIKRVKIKRLEHTTPALLQLKNPLFYMYSPVKLKSIINNKKSICN